MCNSLPPSLSLSLSTYIYAVHLSARYIRYICDSEFTLERVREREREDHLALRANEEDNVREGVVLKSLT